MSLSFFPLSSIKGHASQQSWALKPVGGTQAWGRYLERLVEPFSWRKPACYYSQCLRLHRGGQWTGRSSSRCSLGPRTTQGPRHWSWSQRGCRQHQRYSTQFQRQSQRRRALVVGFLRTWIIALVHDTSVLTSRQVNHYPDLARNALDPKYTYKLRNATLFHGLSPPEDATPLGIFYPRTAALGGCANHNAMIMMRPSDDDWNQIASISNDSNWKASSIRTYSEKFEDCQ